MTTTPPTEMELWCGDCDRVIGIYPEGAVPPWPPHTCHEMLARQKDEARKTRRHRVSRVAP